MSETELRAMVRQVLGDILKDRRAGKPLVAPAPPAPAVEAVSITGNADLAAFVQRLIGLLDDPVKGAAIRSGNHVFALANGQALAQAQAHTQAPAQATAPATPCPAELSGTITEARIAKIAKLGETDRIVLAPGAVMTPLANDRARAVGLKIERKR
mgnify:FL=1